MAGQRSGDWLCFASDSYFTVRDNVRAIALTIGALRGIERWGASDMIERAFRGFMALPERASSSWRTIFGFEGDAAVTLDRIESRFRELARERHPDVGGDAASFSELTEAREAARRECGEFRPGVGKRGFELGTQSPRSSGFVAH